MIRSIALCLLAVAASSSTAPADLVISQYFVGPVKSQWIELFNSGSSAIDLSGYSVGLWQDANAEGYKSGAAPTASVVLPNVSLASGGVFLLSDAEAGLPLDLVADYKNSVVLRITGNDSFALYTAGAYSTGSLVDAIGFTNSGNEGAYKGFVRISLDDGYDLITGSNVLDFAAIWESVTVVQVLNAEPGMHAHLGTTALTAAVAAIPEPTAALFGGALASLLGLTIARRPAVR